MPNRRFPPSWSIEERQESFIVTDATGQALAYVYFEDEPQRQMSMQRLSRVFWGCLDRQQVTGLASG